MDEPYQYSPLRRDVQEIRLVPLAPGNWEDIICCTMRIVQFQSLPAYEALSYVWGDASVQQNIIIDSMAFHVTQNLWKALKGLRDASSSRVLWIDAICINQNDKGEKYHQVAMMRDIYSCCQKAIILLGEDVLTTESGSKPDSARKACEMLEMIGRQKHLNELPCFSAAGDGQRTEISEEYSAHFEAFQKLVNLEWWRRIWVIQEMVLPKCVQFFYSSEELPYRTIRSAVDNLQTHGTTCCKQYRYTLRAKAFDPILTLQEQVEPMVYARESWNDKSSLTIFNLRRQFSGSRATQKRDLFYALLGLVADWKDVAPLYPDYKISEKEAISQAVFKCILSESGRLETINGERGVWPRKGEDLKVVVPS
jgi:hypothetical protein